VAKKIFRKISLERLASPEQLDQLVSVTSPIGWTTLLGVALLLGAVVIWSIYSKIPTTVNGGGILIKTGGVVNVVVPVPGQISHIYVEDGDLVKKGQIIGRMAQPKLLDEIRAAKLDLAEMESRELQIGASGSQKMLLEMNSLDKERENLTHNIEVARERLKWLTEKIKLQETLLTEGLITRQTLIDTQTRKNNVVESIESDKSELKKLDINEKELKNQEERNELDRRNAINEARRKLNIQEAEYEFSSKIICTSTGSVVEIRASEGQVVGSGDAILSLELTGHSIQDLQTLLYMPPAMGKLLKPGMLARVTPQNIKREEFGYMLGIVTHVAEFPSTSQGMARLLKNQKLVDQFSSTGAPLAVFVDLIPDATTPSGYKWSSSTGPPSRIFSGTLCNGSVEVFSQPPLSLAIPYLKKQTGLD